MCNATGSSAHRFSSDCWRVVRCTSCRMVYLANPPLQQSLSGDFAWEITSQREREKRRSGRRFYYLVSNSLKRIKRWLRNHKRHELGLILRLYPEGGSVLDIGCGNGATLRALIGTAVCFQLSGIEPSPSSAKIANKLCQGNGGRVESATALDGIPRFAPASFDLVVMRSYLEHEVYAAQVLRAAIDVLKPGGCVMIKVPNATCWNAKLRGRNWPGVRHPDHVNYFSSHHLRMLLRGCGFADFRFEPLSLLPTCDNLWVVARRATMAEGP